MEIGLLGAALVCGLLVSMVGLPPLVGYLAAGFGLAAFGFESSEPLEAVADLGVLLLLFGIGLKLRWRTLARPAVWGTASFFALIGTTVGAAALLLAGLLGAGLVGDLDLRSALIVAFALSFSSTVFAVKALEATNETSSLSGRIAVGVLVIQDIMAVLFLAAIGSDDLTWWVLAVVPAALVFRPVAGWLLDRSGHGEILVLLGFTLAIGVGAQLFELIGLKPDLGALVAGFLLSQHPRAGELADRLLSFKDLFLVGFFLSIGLVGLPELDAWLLGLAALLLIPTRSLLYIVFFMRFRLRARTSLHSALSLSSYSEFGLIVTSAALAEGALDEAWLGALAVAVAASFVVASAMNSQRYRLYDLGFFQRLSKLQRTPPIPEDSIIDLGPVAVIVFGMGRVGTGAFDELCLQVDGDVIGVDRDPDTVDLHCRQGRRVVRGDALDRDFWERAQFHPEVELVVAAMSNHAANLECVRRVREYLPDARIAGVTSYPDQVVELREAGVGIARNLYDEAGQALATDATRVLMGAEEPDEV